MKKKWKIFWITCAVSGTVGIVFLILAFIMGVTFQKVESMMPNGISIGKFEEVESSDIHDLYEGITALDIDLKAGVLKILVSDGEEVEIMTEGISKKLKFSCYREGNTLVVDTIDDIRGIVNQSIGEVTIYLPDELYLDYAEISVGAGTLYVESIKVGDFSVDVGAGTADIGSFEAKRADFDCGAGEMMTHGFVDKEIDIDCGMGNVTFNTYDSEQNYNYTLSCGIGEIICGSNRYSGIGGEQKIDHHHGFKEMDIDCGLGEVEVVFEGGH